MNAFRAHPGGALWANTHDQSKKNNLVSLLKCPSGLRWNLPAVFIFRFHLGWFPSLLLCISKKGTVSWFEPHFLNNF